METRLGATILSAVFLVPLGCDSVSEETADTSSSSSPPECRPGESGCPCPDAGGCSDGLVCRDGICREMPDDVGPSPDADSTDVADAGPSVTAFVRDEAGERLEAAVEGLGPEFVRKLVDSPAAEKLTRLNLAANEIGDEGARILAESDALAQLEYLDLSDNGIGTAGAEALAAVERFESLETLKLADNDLGEDAAEALGEGPLLRSVPMDARVDLSGHDWSEASRKALGARGRLPGICGRIDLPDLQCEYPSPIGEVDVGAGEERLPNFNSGRTECREIQECARGNRQ